MFTLREHTGNNDILKTIEETGNNLFITGQAGTGKSWLLRQFIATTKKNTVVVAPTGIAALNVNGQTIHSFFDFPPSVITKDNINIRHSKTDIMNEIDVIVIDEISMVRVDMIEGIDFLLKQYRKKERPFGGVQMIFFGDLFQIDPVVSEQAAFDYIASRYKSNYFFEADVFKNIDIFVYELTEQKRQTDQAFISILNDIRIDVVSDDDLNKLNRNNVIPKQDDDYIYLTTTRKSADDINYEKLNLIDGEVFSNKADITGSFLKKEKDEKNLPAPVVLEIKKTSKIIMLNNDMSDRWVNGSKGIVTGFDDDTISVLIDNNEYEVTEHTWKEKEYVYNKETKKLEKKDSGTFTQFPIQLANAITIHKSQGLTLDKVILDVGNGGFASGQIYVGLSRCKTFENLIIKTPIGKSDISVDPVVVEFFNKLRSIKTNAVLIRKQILIKEFDKELNQYLFIQENSGNDAAKSIKNFSRNFKNIQRLIKNTKSRNFGKMHYLKYNGKSLIEYSIEALFVKKKYRDIVPDDIYKICLDKLTNANVNFDEFEPENRP